MRWVCCICFSDTRHHLLGNGTIQCARTAEAIYTCSSRESLHRNRLGSLFSSWCATHTTITTAVDQPDVSSPIPSISHFLQVPLSPQSPDSPPASGSKWLVMSVQLLILRLASCSCRCLFDPAFRRFAIYLFTRPTACIVRAAAGVTPSRMSCVANGNRMSQAAMLVFWVARRSDLLVRHLN